MRCSMCGHDSPAGSLFCLNCGSQLAAGYGAQTPAAPPGLPTAGRCPTCGTDNPGAMKFCRNCGTVLTGAAPGAPPPGPPPGAYGAPAGAPFGAPAPAPAVAAPPSYPGAGLVVCPRCNSQTPAGFAFCQQCGVQLPAVDPSGPTMAGGGPDSLRAGSIGRPGAGLAAPMPPPGPPPAAPLGSRPGAPPAAVAGSLSGPAAGAAWGSAISVNRDGSDGDRFPLTAEFVVIGRAGADVAFDQDRFLARSHARIERSGDTVRIVPIDTLNGVFKKLDAPIELVDGSIALVGREVLRFEVLDADE